MIIIYLKLLKGWNILSGVVVYFYGENHSDYG